MTSQHDASSRAVGWASVETLVRHGLQFASGVVLARLLTPDDFGLVAMLAIFVGLAMTLSESGFGAALIQQPRESEADASTAFWYNLAVGTVMALALAGSAPLIARFYGRDALVPITWALAANIWLTSLMTVHVALLTRRLNFRVQALASGVGNAGGVALAIALALRGAGVWALVAQTLATTFLTVALLWTLHPWRPRATFDVRSFRKLFAYGGYIFASSVVNAATLRVHTLLIGRFHSGSDLGTYSRAVTTRDSTQAMLTTVFSRVAFPVFARHGSDPEALRARVKSGNQLIMAVSLPAMLGLALVADNAVPVLFGPQWSGTVPILQVLCLAGAIWPLQVSNVQVMMAQGRSSVMFALGLAKATILVTAMIIATRWGIVAIAWATVVGAAASFAINTGYSRRSIGYGALEQLRDIGAYILLTMGMLLIVAATGRAIEWMSPGKRLIVEVATGAGFYVGSAALLRLPAVAFAMEVLRALRPPQQAADRSPR